MINKGQIFKIHSDFYYVKCKDEIFECKIREVLKKQKAKILVGDFVEFRENAIEKILPRKNFIPRPNVANVDQIIVVSAIKEPDLSFLQLNRYISLAKYYQIPTILCFNKNDLSMDDSVIEKVFSIYEPLGYEIVFTSALEKLGLEDFEEILKNKTSVLCGSSGVGKSSLINALNPNVNLRTSEVSSKTERGTNTTRHSEIININSKIRLVDTPGFSNLKFDFILPSQVDELFNEIKKYKSECKFTDCLHINEIGCNVLKNIENINSSRYDSYLSFLEEAKEYKEKIKLTGTKTETTSKLQHNKTTTKISSRKRQPSRNTLKQKIYKEVEGHNE